MQALLRQLVLLGLIAVSTAFCVTGTRLSARRHAPARLQAFPPDLGGDLAGGKDEDRNADVDALRRAFFARGEPNADAHSADVRLGRYHDLPLARWSMVFLPTQQVLLNVFQPQYTLMFESLLAGPRPWLYLHVLLPGGAENLANPDYALPSSDESLQAQLDGFCSKAPLVGTLMEVVDVEKQADARLAMVAQGLGRAVVVRGTQATPYARADVQLLPDAEALLSAACAAGRWLREAGELARTSADRRERLALGGAVGEAARWRPYENAPSALVAGSEPGKVRPPPAMTKFDADVAERAAGAAGAAAVTTLPSADGESHEPPLLVESLVGVSAALAAYSDDVAGEEEAEAEDAGALLSLEQQLWVELDHFLRSIASMSGSEGRMPVPKQLLCLLPPPPEAGWPADFLLAKIVTEIKKAEMTRRALTDAPAQYDAEPYVPLHPAYPPRRRAERLSWSVWLFIREEGLELQPLMEAPSTSDRLRMALLRVRELVERLPEAEK